MSGPGVFGHRGGDGGPENSVEAIALAARAGAAGVEIDIQVGPDGTLIAGHDLPGSDSASQSSGTSPPASFGEVLAAMEQAGIRLLIDFKSGDRPGPEAAIVAEALGAAARPDLILVSSFSVPFLDELRHLAPQFPLYPIISLRQNFFRPFDHRKWSGASVLVTALLVNPFLLIGLRRNRRELLVWFAVTEWPALVKLAARLGAGGLIVGRVARTVAILAERTS